MTFPYKQTTKGIEVGDTIDDITIGEIAEGTKLRNSEGTWHKLSKGWGTSTLWRGCMWRLDGDHCKSRTFLTFTKTFAPTTIIDTWRSIHY